MKKIVLINPPPIRQASPAEFSPIAAAYFRLRDLTSLQWGDQQCEPNTGLLALGSLLERAGFDVEIHDLNIAYVGNPCRFDGNILPSKIIDLLKPSVEKALAVGIASLTVNAKFALHLARLAKQWNPQVHVTMGGVFPTASPGFFLKESAVDSVVLGEGHDSYPKLLRSITRGGCLPENVLLRTSHHSDICTQTVSVTKKPTSIPPFPAFHLLSDYCKPRIFRLHSAFGCRFGCEFCSPTRFYNQTVRMRDPKDFAKHVQSVVKEYNITDYLIGDLTFFQIHDHSAEVCKWLSRMRIPDSARYWCQTRPDLLTPDVIELLAQSGCQQVGIGIESFSESIVSQLKDITGIRTLRMQLRELRKCDIEVQIYLMTGIPGECVRDVFKTIETTCELLEDGLVQHINVGIFVPFKGLPLDSRVRILDWDPENYAMSVYPNQWPLPVYETDDLSRFQIRALWELSLASYMRYL